MAAEAQRAPRVARDQTSMADAAASLEMSAHAAALKTLDAFKFDETTPFGGTGADLAYTCLNRAHALTIVIANLLETARENDDVVRKVHLGSAIDAIGTLVAFAAFGLKGVES